MKKILIVSILILFFQILYSQVDTLEIVNEKLFQLIEDASENIEDGQFYDILEELL